MALIKALTNSVSSAIGDQFKEYVDCPQIGNDIIIQRGTVHHGAGNTNYSSNIISNGSTIAVPQGMAMMIIDNGKIVEFSAESGTYTWDSSSESSIFTGGLGQGIVNTFKTIGSRFTYGGQEAKDQRVYFVNIKVIPANTFGSSQPETVYDPVYGSVEITYNGEYSIQVVDPIILVNNMIGANPNKDTLSFDDIFKNEGRNILKSKFAQKVSEGISNVMTMYNISFNRIQSYKTDIINQMNQLLSDDWMQKYGIQITDVALNVNATEEARKIIQQTDAEISKTTRMGQVYSNNMAGAMAAASAEAMKTAAGNENGAMMGFMGMSMAQQQGVNMMGTVANMPAQPVQPEQPTYPQPGTLFNNQQAQSTQQAQPVQPTPEQFVQPTQPVQPEQPAVAEQPVPPVVSEQQTQPVQEQQTQPVQEQQTIGAQSRICSNCGNQQAEGNFCIKCGQPLNK